MKNKIKYMLFGIFGIGVIGFAVSCGSSYAPLNPVPAPTPVVIKPAGIIDDWEDGNTSSDLGAGEAPSTDPFGSTMTIATGVPGNPAGTAGGAIKIFGDLNQGIGPNWPWAELEIAIPAGFDIDALAPTQRLHFSYKAGLDSVGIAHFVRWVYNVTPVDFCWWEFSYTPVDTTWHDMEVYLTNVSGTPSFAQCTWGTPVPWATVKANGLTILRFSSGGSPLVNTKYDLTLDDVYLH